MSLKDKTVVVTGGSRGLGLGLVEALVAHGARVTVVARDADALESVRARLGVATISADVTDETAAHRILAGVRPDILALNAGAKPRMGRLDQLSWADFTATWETDVKAGLYWLQGQCRTPRTKRNKRPPPVRLQTRCRATRCGRSWFGRGNMTPGAGAPPRCAWYYRARGATTGTARVSRRTSWRRTSGLALLPRRERFLSAPRIGRWVSMLKDWTENFANRSFARAIIFQP
jgi:NAD(P)-dependent dehydrogenase (short-subunit alcohol dehydrogenase family)